METVDVVQGQHVDEAAYGVDADEVARNVEVRAAIGKAGLVADFRAGHHHALHRTHGQGLAEGLNAVEEARRRRAVNQHNLAVDADAVCLRIALLQCRRQADAVALHGDGGKRQFEPRSLLDELGQVLRVAFQRFVALRITDKGFLAQFETPGLRGPDLLGQGHDMEIGILRPSIPVPGKCQCDKECSHSAHLSHISTCWFGNDGGKGNVYNRVLSGMGAGMKSVRNK